MPATLASPHHHLTLTTEHVRARLGLGKVDQVLALIHSGVLKAVNVAAPGKRRLWRVSEAALADFVERRQVTAPPPPAPVLATRQKQQKQSTQYF